MVTLCLRVCDVAFTHDLGYATRVSTLWFRIVRARGKSNLSNDTRVSEQTDTPVKPSYQVQEKGSRWQFILPISIAPALVALCVQLSHWVNVPIWDEWDTPGTALLRFAEHRLTWADLFAQHNEPRLVFPRIVHIGLAFLGGWDVRQGMALTFIAATIASLSVLMWLRLRPRRINLPVLVTWTTINFLLFAPSQYENFLSGFMWYLFVPVLCLLACITINLSRQPLRRKVLINAGLALVATYSYGHGMLLWLFGIPIAEKQRTKQRGIGSRIVWYSVYAALGIAAIATYFVGYRRPPIAPPPARITQFPLILDFLVVWLGAVLRSNVINSRIIGTCVGIVLLFALLAAAWFIYQNKSGRKNYYPWLVLLGFSLTAGLMLAVNRVNIGTDRVFNIRLIGFSGVHYNAVSVFVYVALVGVLYNVYLDINASKKVCHVPFVAVTSVCLMFFAIDWSFSLLDESSRLPLFQQNRNRARTAVIWSKAIPDNPDITLAYPYANQVPQRVEEMERFGVLTLPKVSKRVMTAITKLPDVTNPEGGNLDIHQVVRSDIFRVAGWARNPRCNCRADYVVLGIANGEQLRPFIAIATGLPRSDVVTAFGPKKLKDCGFDQQVDASKLPSGRLTLRAWAIDLEQQEVFPIHASLQLESSRELNGPVELKDSDELYLKRDGT